jgi:hypothetical protein
MFEIFSQFDFLLSTNQGLKNETKREKMEKAQKRNETKQNETKRNKTKRNEKNITFFKLLCDVLSKNIFLCRHFKEKNTKWRFLRLEPKKKIVLYSFAFPKSGRTSKFVCKY